MDPLEEAILNFNKKAMLELSQHNFKHAIFYLNQALINLKALKRSSYEPKLWTITYNNLGCYYKKLGNPQAALDYLSRAASLEKYIPNELGNIAGTHLNICSVLSDLSDHKAALKHALKSLDIQRAVIHSHPELINTLLASYHNAGYQYQLLNKNKNAIEMYKQGISLGIKLAAQNTLAFKTIKKSYELLASPKKVFRVANRHRSPCGVSRRIHKAPKVPRTPVKAKSNLFIIRDRSVNYNRHSSADKRIDLAFLRKQEKRAAVRIQAWWRGVSFRVKQKQRQIKNEIEKASVRARNAIDELNKLKMIASSPPVVLLQARIRMNIARDRVRDFPNRAVAIQKHVRGWQCRSLYKKIRAAVVFIQQKYRHYSKTKFS